MYEWDAANLRKLADHGITKDEAIEAMEGITVELPTQMSAGEYRYKLLGETAGGQVLIVLWTEGRAADTIRIFNAYKAEPREVRIYRNERRD